MKARRIIGVGQASAPQGKLQGNSPLVASHYDPLAQRDEWGLLHQTSALNPTDYEPRLQDRFWYYFKSRNWAMSDPAYVGSLQVALRRNGYYCGPIDGVFSDNVSYAIARLQKNHSMPVDGTLTIDVRRALHLP